MLHRAASEAGLCCHSLSDDRFWLVSGVLQKELVVLSSVDAELVQADPDGAAAVVVAKLQVLMDTCREELGIRWRTYTSHPQANCELLYQEFDQVRELSGAAIMLGIQTENLRYEELCIAGAELYTTEFMRAMQQREVRFWTAMTRNDFRTVQEILHEIIQEEFQVGRMNIQCAAAMFYALLNKVRCAIDAMRPLAGPDAFAAFETAPRILYRKSLQDVAEQIDVIFDTFYHDESKSTAPPPWLQKLDHYIRTNFCDPNLNVATAADRFGLNAAYVSRVFKKCYGHSILEQINLLRIEYACQLMQENRLLKDVAAEVGYDNPQRMNRVFLKYTGITPKAYMERQHTLFP